MQPQTSSTGTSEWFFTMKSEIGGVEEFGPYEFKLEALVMRRHVMARYRGLDIVREYSEPYRLRSPDGELETLNTRQMRFEPLGASDLFSPNGH